MFTEENAIMKLKESVVDGESPLENLINTDETMENILYDLGFEELAVVFGEIQGPLYHELFEEIQK